MKKFIYFFIIILAFNACKDDCPVEPDPCSEYPSEFKIITSQEKRTWCTGDPTVDFGDYEEYQYDTFAITPALRVEFKVNFEYDSLKWRLGNDPTMYSLNRPIIDFNQPLGEILVVCIGWRTVNTECFGSQDDGIDTITKKISIMHINDAPIFGTFRGVNEEQSDSFSVKLGRDTLQDSMIGEYYLNFFEGLPQASTNRIDNVKYKWFTCQGTSGNGHVSPDGLSVCHFDAQIDRKNSDLITIKWINNNDMIPRIFRGIRLK